MYFVYGALTLLFSLYCLLAELFCGVSTTILRVCSDGAEPVPADGDRRAELEIIKEIFKDFYMISPIVAALLWELCRRMLEQWQQDTSRGF